MKTPEEKRFERIKDVLLAESNGNTPVRIASTRTLFGIKSHAEEVIERTVKEMEEDQRKANTVNQTEQSDDWADGYCDFAYGALDDPSFELPHELDPRLDGPLPSFDENKYQGEY